MSEIIPGYNTYGPQQPEEWDDEGPKHYCKACDVMLYDSEVFDKDGDLACRACGGKTKVWRENDESSIRKSV